MKKITLVVMMILSTMILFGNENNIEIVKNGVLGYNQRITVGQALDNWKNCQFSDWEEYQTDNGIQVVKFICVEKDVKEFTQKIKTFLNPKDIKDASSLDLDSINKTLYFTMNVDKSFQIDIVEDEIIWKDMKRAYKRKNVSAIMKEVYNNKITFDLRKINHLAIKEGRESIQTLITFINFNAYRKHAK